MYSADRGSWSVQLYAVLASLRMHSIPPCIASNLKKPQNVEHASWQLPHILHAPLNAV